MFAQLAVLVQSIHSFCARYPLRSQTCFGLRLAGWGDLPSGLQSLSTLTPPDPQSMAVPPFHDTEPALKAGKRFSWLLGSLSSYSWTLITTVLWFKAEIIIYAMKCHFPDLPFWHHWYSNVCLQTRSFNVSSSWEEQDIMVGKGTHIWLHRLIRARAKKGLQLALPSLPHARVALGTSKHAGQHQRLQSPKSKPHKKL